MWEDTQQVSISGKPLTKAVIAQMLIDNFEKLPDRDQKIFLYGPWYLAGNAGVAGLIANSFYRRALHVSQASFSSSLPMAVLPFITTAALYNAAVSTPLIYGDLNCPTCSLVRAALVGVIGGCWYPVLLALPLNFGLAARYSTTPLPEKGNVLRYVVDVSRPYFRKMVAVMMLQAAFGTYLGVKHYDVYAKLAQITFGRSGEELED